MNFTVLTGNAELYIYDDWACEHEFKDYVYIHMHRKEIIEINKDLKENYYLIIKCSEPSFIQLKYETDYHFKGYDTLIPNEVNLVPINNKGRAYYNLYNPNYNFPFKKINNINNDFYYSIDTMDCSMDWRYIDTLKSNLTHFDFKQRRDELYSYLSTYGFVSQINTYTHTPSENENCGLIVYNGEISDKRPLLITSDMPHKSDLIDTYYVFPIIFDEKKDDGIIIQFKVYNYTSDLNEKYKYKIIYSIEGINEKTIELIDQDTIMLDKNEYKEIFKNKIIGNLYITLRKKDSEGNYYVTTNVKTTKISPEFIYPNQDYEFKLRPLSSKYLYSPINKDSDGYIQFNGINDCELKIYAKIVKKDEVEEGYNWNKRVKLPEADDPNLIPINEDGVIAYYKNQTEKCTNGCELYFQIKSEEKKIENNSKISLEDLMSISFTFKEEEYKKKEPSPSNNNAWKIAVAICVPVVVIIGIVILVVLLRKKKASNIDLSSNNKDINELKIPLE